MNVCMYDKLKKEKNEIDHVRFLEVMESGIQLTYEDGSIETWEKEKYNLVAVSHNGFD